MIANTELLKRGYNSFEIIGDLRLNESDFKIDAQSTRLDYYYNVVRLNVNVDKYGAPKTNFITTEMLGGFNFQNHHIYCFGTKIDKSGMKMIDYCNRLAVNFDDRFDQRQLNLVADECFIKISVEVDDCGNLIHRKFLSEFDAILYLQEHLKDNMKLKINGIREYTNYEERVIQRNRIKSVELMYSQVENKALFKQTVIFPNNIKEYFKNVYEEMCGIYTIEAHVVDYNGFSKQNDLYPIELKSNKSLKESIGVNEKRRFVAEGFLKHETQDYKGVPREKEMWVETIR